MWKGHSTNVHFDKAVFGLLFYFIQQKTSPPQRGGKRKEGFFFWGRKFLFGNTITITKFYEEIVMFNPNFLEI